MEKPNSFRCEFCNSTFTRHDILQDHAKGKHENKNGTDAINAVSVLHGDPACRNTS